MYYRSHNYCHNLCKNISSALLCLGASGHHAHLPFLIFLWVLSLFGLLGRVNLSDVDIQPMAFKVIHHLFFIVYKLYILAVSRDFQLELHLFRGGWLV